MLPLDPSTPHHSPGPPALNSLSGPRTEITPQASAKLELSTTWGDLHFRLFTPSPLAGRDAAADRLACFSSLSFVWFGLLRCPRGWGQSAHTGCAASLCAPASLAALLCSVPREDSRGQETVSACPCHPLDSGRGRPRGPEDRRGTLMSVLPAAPARLGPLLRPQCPDAAHSSSPTPRPGPPLLSSLGICLWPASKCLSSPYDFL